MEYCKCGNVLFFQTPSLKCLKCTLPIPYYERLWQPSETDIRILNEAKPRFIERYKTLKNEDSTEDFVESIQCAIVRAGGCFIPRSVLMSKTVAELNAMLTPNSIAAVFIKDKNE
jgi:hypothetical protein